MEEQRGSHKRLKVLLFGLGPNEPTAQAVGARRLSGMLPILGEEADVSVVTLCRRGRVHEVLSSMGFPAQALGYGSPFSSLGCFIRLVRLLNSRTFDIVQAQEPIPAVLAGIARLFGARRTRLIYSRHHTSGGRTMPRAVVLRSLSWAAGHLSDRTFAVSEVAASCARELDRTPTHKISMVSDGVPEPRPVPKDEVFALRARLGIPFGVTVVGTVSRLRHEKGVDLLVRAAILLRATHPVRLVIVGAGPEEARLRVLAAPLGEAVHFVGHQEDLSVWYSLLDIVVIPSRKEALPRVALEAMAAARPIIASRIGGLPEAVNEGVTGLLVEPEDAEALASAMRGLMADPEGALRLARAGRERFESLFGYCALIDRWLAGWAATLASAHD